MYSPQDPTHALGEFAQRASRYRGGEINLNGMVTRDDRVVVRGGYATVFRGVLNPQGWRVAIKTARGEIPGDEDTINRVLREVHLWSKLHHENILPLLGITTDFDFTMSIISPWMERGDARRYVQNINIDPRPLIEGIARGLHYLHNCEPGPVFHGDLKGANVLISDDHRPLLADFGFSYLTNSSFSMPLPEDTGGTIRWMAPEMFEELFTRKDPFYRFRGQAAIITRILTSPPDRPTDDDTCRRMTEQWWSLLSLCWKIDPGMRPTMPYIIEMIDRIKNPPSVRARTGVDVDAALVRPSQRQNTYNISGFVAPQTSFAVEAANQRAVNT
ncbi:kinase-like domain-containing protein [Pisolithus marmoratus]|nr:kinase-like domain-containing protein [Pisolithus marmoratus]